MPLLRKAAKILAAITLCAIVALVILMRAGLAVDTAEYTNLAEDLANHGYVVAGFDAPYRSTLVVFPDGRVIARTPQNNADLL